MGSSFGIPVMVAEKISQRAQISVGSNDDIAALAAVAAIGSPARHVGLFSEATAAVSAVSGLAVNGDSIREHNLKCALVLLPVLCGTAYCNQPVTERVEILPWDCQRLKNRYCRLDPESRHGFDSCFAMIDGCFKIQRLNSVSIFGVCCLLPCP